jgi:hypothetical protein
LGLRNLPVIPGVEHLTVLADHDQNGEGEKAANALQLRYREAGLETRVLRPKHPGTDFNDVLLKVKAARPLEN